ncbi:LysR family transcriptional regulator [Cronobacter sakazakii]
MHKTTLEQWALLDKVVEEGSFARAAESTHRSQSSVSYNLALLQERLGVALLETQGRRAVLTPAGELLLAQVRPLLSAFSWVETHAATLRDGVRTRIDLVVDNIFPRETLFAILREFQRQHPSTQVQLTEVLESQSDVIAAHSSADLLVLSRREDSLGRGEWLMNVNFVAVAHRDHPLAQMPGPIGEEALGRFTRIRLAGGQTQSPGGAPEQWVFSTVDAAIEAVMHQVGYGWLPEARIAAPLSQGLLRALPLAHGARRATPLHLMVKKDLQVPDAAVSTLIALFSRLCEA